MIVTPEVVGDSPGRRVEILADGDAVHVTVSRFGPAQEGAGLHVHHDHTDLFYVLEGELTVRLGAQDEQRTVPAGSLAAVPPGVIHGFRNASDAEERHLNFHAPGSGFATYMRGLRDGVKVSYDQHEPPADGGRPISDAIVASGDLLFDGEALRVERVRVDGALRGPATGYVLDGDDAGAWVQLAAGEELPLSGLFLSVSAGGS